MSGKVSALNARLIDNLEKTLLGKVILVVIGTLALALASQISVPMVPVPITMQTFAVTMIGALYGWRLGGLTVLAWLAEAMVGFPVLAEFQSGIAPFMGPTAGYLVAFPLMAIFVGFLTEKGISANRLFAGFLLHLAANLLCLLLGWIWLAQVIGAEKAWIVGVVPFLIGAVLKSALAATVLKATVGRVKTS